MARSPQLGLLMSCKLSSLRLSPRHPSKHNSSSAIVVMGGKLNFAAMAYTVHMDTDINVTDCRI